MKSGYTWRALEAWTAWSLFAAARLIHGAELPYLYEADVRVPMRDGITLSANIFRPKETGKYPAILMRTPYGKGDQNSGDAKRYTSAGYALVIQDCRGRGNSQGDWDPFRGDVEDGLDTQEWVAGQPWCNGDLGTAGGSYVGWTQWATAAKASRHLKAMVPLVPFANAYDIAYQDGAFQLGLLMGWGAMVGGIVLPPQKFQEAYLHLPLKTWGSQFEKPVAYLNDWIAHSSPDSYWEKRGMGYHFEEITVPILNVGGWYDIFSKGTLELTRQVRTSSRDRGIRRNQFVIIGPWTHGIGGRKAGELDFGKEAVLSIEEYQFRWFEYWLKGHETGVQEWPALYLFVMGENQWRGENEWPLKRTVFTSYFLHSGGHGNTASGDGTLSQTEPAEEPSDHYTYTGNDPVPSTGGNNLVGATAGAYDQSKLEQRSDILVYTTPPLEHDIEVTGPVKLSVWIASTALDTDFTGKLVDVTPEGKAYNLCEGILRARYRRGLESPKLLEPGKPESCDIDLWVTSNLFKKGHRIRLEVSSSNFPRFDRNPNSGKPFGTDTEMLPADQTILHDSRHPSQLILPVIPR